MVPLLLRSALFPECRILNAPPEYFLEYVVPRILNTPQYFTAAVLIVWHTLPGILLSWTVLCCPGILLVLFLYLYCYECSTGTVLVRVLVLVLALYCTGAILVLH